jgi:hypothetical protein
VATVYRADSRTHLTIDFEQSDSPREEEEIMKRYFKSPTDPQVRLGTGVAYFEFDGDVPLRQVERYGDDWFDSRAEYHAELGPGLVDQPPHVLGLGVDDEITAEEFERAWSISAERRP